MPRLTHRIEKRTLIFSYIYLHLLEGTSIWTTRWLLEKNSSGEWQNENSLKSTLAVSPSSFSSAALNDTKNSKVVRYRVMRVNISSHTTFATQNKVSVHELCKVFKEGVKVFSNS